MKRNSEKITKALAAVIALSLQLNTIAFASSVVIPDQSQNKNPKVNQTANGTQLVNIRRPNAQGLSHNQYKNLQVDKDGLIFNNSGQISKTQLAGYINGNPNLSGNQGAKIILNEVTGKLPTNLNGYMEIAGNKADLVLANPNGIVGNNFGYINTNRGILTTGIPQVTADGSLDGFIVSNSNVKIEGLGFDATGLSSAEIYANACEVNAKIWANKLKVIAGKNKIDYETGNVKEVLPVNNTTGYILDIGAVGGMYANSIFLVGTSKGLGVNSEGILHSDNIVIDTEGHLRHVGKIEGEKVSFRAKEGLNNTGIIQSTNNTSLSSDKYITNSGTIFGKVDTNINAKENITNTGTVQSDKNIVIASSKNLANNGAISSGKNILVSADGNISNISSIEAGNNSKILSKQNINNMGLINGVETSIVATGNLDNIKAGKIYGNKIKIKADRINNITGTSVPVIAAREDMTLEANIINNKEHGTLTALQDMAVKANTLNNNSATVEAGRNMDLKVGNINNTNEHFTTKMQVVKEEDIIEYQAKGSANRYSKNGTNYKFDVSGTKWHRRHRPDYDVYIYRDESDHLHTPEGDAEDWLKYIYHRTIKENVVFTTDPGKITAGRNIVITGNTLSNDKSHIIAGGVLTTNVKTVNNIEGPGKQYVDDIGTVHSYWRHHKKGKDNTGHRASTYSPATVITDIAVKATKCLAKTTPSSCGVTASNNIYNSYSGFFSKAADMTAGYYVETDPKFTNKKAWLSSDYFLTQMQYDQEKVAKRLGDGYYEQKLIRDQVMNLTGKRFVGSYASEDAEYKAMMDAAVEFAKTNEVVIGVALTAEQEAKLKSPLVWMVEKSIVLPNGEIVKALVPTVYLTKSDADYEVSAAIIDAENIDIKTVNDILNQGTIVSKNITNISANNINNNYGTIRGSDVILQAQNDVKNIGGGLVAEKSMKIIAGRDINVGTTTSTSLKESGNRTAFNQVGSITVTGKEGKLNMAAGRDANLTAADISLTGEDGKANIHAERDVNLASVKTSSSNSLKWDKKNYRNDSSIKDVGTSIQSKGSLNITAGSDINVKSAYVKSEKDLMVRAGKNINIKDGRDREIVDEHHVHKGRSGGGNSQTYTSDDQLNGDYTRASIFSGEKVTMSAGKDANITGSNVVGTNDVIIKAKENINITPTPEKQEEKHFSKLKEKGVFGSGIGFTIGTQTTKETSSGQSNMKAGSTIGSITGNVDLNAGKDVNIEGSNIIAGKDINTSGENVNIKSTSEKYDSQYKYEYNLTGLTVSVSGGIVDRAQKVIGSVERAREVSDDRLSALYGINAVQDVKDVIRDDRDNKTFNVNIGLGSTKINDHSTSTSIITKDSKLKAREKINVTATKKDINLQGSIIEGKEVRLKAKDNIHMNRSKNVSTNDTKMSKSSAGVGVSISTAGGIGPYLNASKAMEKNNTDSITNKPNSVTAKNTLVIESGKDTNVIGSKVKGDKVLTTIGGDLNIESKQDINTYKEKSASASIGLTIGQVTGRPYTGKIDSTYKSVTEQAGITAGKQGFDIKVEGNTDLKGATIDSTATLDKNKLSTGTITFSDIKNKAKYKTSGGGFSYDGAATKDSNTKLGEKGLIPNIPMSSGDEASSTTKSGVAPGTIIIRKPDKQKQDISTLNRDMTNTLNKLDEIFDKKTVKERQELAGLFAKLAFNAIHDVKMTKKQRIAAHGLIGFISSDLAGSNNPASSMLAAGVNEFIVQELIKNPKIKRYYEKHPDELQWISVAIGSAVGGITGGNIYGGASIAASGTKNNQHGAQPNYEGGYKYENNKWFRLTNGEWKESSIPREGTIYWVADPDDVDSYGYEYIRGKDSIADDVFFAEKVVCYIPLIIKNNEFGAYIIEETPDQKKLIVRQAGYVFCEAIITAQGFDPSVVSEAVIFATKKGKTKEERDSYLFSFLLEYYQKFIKILKPSKGK